MPNVRDVPDDAWGAALLDFHEGRDVPDLLLDVAGGATTTAMHPSWFFRAHDEWDAWERDLLAVVADGRGDGGPVLDVGCGAGRAALHFQAIGLDVTAIDSSPGAVEVCVKRGVRDARLGDAADLPVDKAWGAVLLLCGNLGLGGSVDANRALLTRLAERCRPGAVLVGDSVNGEHHDLELRIRYRDLTGAWWRQRNVDLSEVPALVAGTGWTLERQVVDEGGVDHAVLLRRE